jgi:hypothetical protein
MLTLTDGTFFLPGGYAVPWGCASAPTGVAPEALQERGCSYKVFLYRVCQCARCCFQSASVSAGLSGAVRTH